MINFFKNNEEAKLKKKYDQLLKQSFELSRINRKKSDLKAAEANDILIQLEKLQVQKK